MKTLRITLALLLISSLCFGAVFRTDNADFSDTISGNPLLVTLTTGRPLLVDDVYTVFGEDEATINEDGLNSYPAFTELHHYTSDYANWIISGNVTLSQGEASPFETGVYSAKYNISAPTNRTIQTNTITEDANGKTIQFSMWVKAIQDTSIRKRVISNVGVLTTVNTAITVAEGWQELSFSYTFVAATTSWYIALFDNSGNDGDMAYITAIRMYEADYPLPYSVNNTGGTLSIPQNYTDGDEGYNWTIGTDLNTVLSSAQGRMVIEWQPKFDYDQAEGATNRNIIGCTTGVGLLYHTGTGGLIKSFDGTKALSKHLNWSAGVTYTIDLKWGTHPTEGANKFWYSITNDSDSSVVGDVDDYDGSWNPTGTLRFGYFNQYWQAVKSIIFYDSEGSTGNSSKANIIFNKLFQDDRLFQGRKLRW